MTVNSHRVGKFVALLSGGKVAFRGFRGRYRLTWKDADGKERSKLVELK